MVYRFPENKVIYVLFLYLHQNDFDKVQNFTYFMYFINYCNSFYLITLNKIIWLITPDWHLKSIIYVISHPQSLLNSSINFFKAHAHIDTKYSQPGFAEQAAFIFKLQGLLDITWKRLSVLFSILAWENVLFTHFVNICCFFFGKLLRLLGFS